MVLNRFMTNIASSDLPASSGFYTSLFGFSIEFESDWFVSLKAKHLNLELGLIDANHQVFPKDAKGTTQGLYLTFVIDDVDEFYSVVTESGIKVIEPPTDTEYGQRRLLIQAPEGTVCDVSSLIK